MSVESVDVRITFRTDGRDHLRVTMDSRDGFRVYPSAQLWPKEFRLVAIILANLKKVKDSFPPSNNPLCQHCSGKGVIQLPADEYGEGAVLPCSCCDGED